jgi:hypothetical protein
MPRSTIRFKRRFGDKYRLHLQGRLNQARNQQKQVASRDLDAHNLRALRSYEKTTECFLHLEFSCL